MLNKYPRIAALYLPELGDPPNLLYSGLVKTILVQVVSYTVARKIISRFVGAFGKPLTYKGIIFHGFPEPDVAYESSETVIKKSCCKHGKS